MTCLTFLLSFLLITTQSYYIVCIEEPECKDVNTELELNVRVRSNVWINNTYHPDGVSQIVNISVYTQGIHSYPHDLVMQLKGPDDVSSSLVRDTGTYEDNWNITFSSTADTIPQDTVYDDGLNVNGDSYMASDDFENILGTNPFGLWTFQIHDDQYGYTGTWINWCIIDLCWRTNQSYSPTKSPSTLEPTTESYSPTSESYSPTSESYSPTRAPTTSAPTDSTIGPTTLSTPSPSSESDGDSEEDEDDEDDEGNDSEKSNSNSNNEDFFETAGGIVVICIIIIIVVALVGLGVYIGYVYRKDKGDDSERKMDQIVDGPTTTTTE